MASVAETGQLDCETVVDRISNLPSGLIDLILKRLPIDVAARMSILSKMWRDVWVTNPYLVFDHVFFSKLVSKNDEETRAFEVSRIISTILLAHSGPIMKFFLYIPQNLPHRHRLDTSFWIKNISNKGVRKLRLYSGGWIAYRIPSYLFSCFNLTHLTLGDCILNPPYRFQGFCNLIKVKLVDVEIAAGMSFGTRLEKLYLTRCTGIEHLGRQFAHSNNLTWLIIINSGKLDLGWSQCMQKLEFLFLVRQGVADSKNEIISLDKLLGDMPMLDILVLDGFFFKSLGSGGAVLKRPITTLVCLCIHRVAFQDLVHIRCILCLIRNSLNLERLEIILEPQLNSSNDKRILDLMVSWGDMILEQLEIIEIHGIVGTRAEFQFVKLLLGSTPSLRSIKLDKHSVIGDSKDELRILQELLLYPRASPTAQIIWT